MKGSRHVSYAEKIVPRAYADEKNNILEVQEFSRPVPYPFDPESWIVCNIADGPADSSPDSGREGGTTGEADVAQYALEPDGVETKSEAEIMAMTRKADVIAYAESIGLTGLTEDMKLDELKAATLQHQNEIY